MTAVSNVVRKANDFFNVDLAVENLAAEFRSFCRFAMAKFVGISRGIP